jgi:hypothetical protein
MIDNKLLIATLKELLENKEAVDSSNIPFEIGKYYFFRTVTYHLVGEVIEINGNFITLNNVAWIADSGRFQQAINKGALLEVEPVDVKCFVNINSLTDAFEWSHGKQGTQK